MDYRQRTTVMAVAGWAIPDNGLQTTRLLLRKTTSQQDYETTEGGGRWGYAKTTSQQDYETTSGAAAGGASQELWNYG